MTEYLPPEIITQILKRLPVESVVRGTAVCKAWYALIKDPSFISTHLQAVSLQDDLFFQVVRDGRDAFHLLRDNDSLEEYKQLHFPFKHEYWRFRTVGTCNGLICLAQFCPGYWNVVLWNPSIQKHFILPNLNMHFKRSVSCTFEFGFDSVSNDYKVLLVDAYDLAEVWLFSLNRRSWSWMSLSDVSPKHSFRGGSRKATIVKGSLHWPMNSYDMKNGFISNMILTFDISTEKFYVMNCPETLVHSKNQITLIKYEESIAMIASNCFKDSYAKQHELWVVKEYGVNSSWTKVLHWIDENEELIFYSDMIDVFGVRKNGKLLLKVRKLHKNEYELATLDLNCCQQQRLMPVVGIKAQYNDSIFMGFVESLVLLDKGEEDPVGQNGFRFFINHFPSLRKRPPTVRRNAQINSVRVSSNFGDPLADQGASINPQDVPESSNARVLDPSQPNKPPQGHSSSLALVAGSKSGSDRVPNPWQQRGSHAPSFAQVLARNVVKT